MTCRDLINKSTNKQNRLVKKLTKELASIKMPVTRRARQARQGASVKPLPGALKNRQVKPVNIRTVRDGVLCLTQEESWGPVNTGSPQVRKFAPGNSGLPMLDNVASLYDQYKIVSCLLEYRTVTGTTTSGELVSGVDYNPETTDTSYESIVLLSDKMMGPLYQDMQTRVSVDKSMKNMSWRYTTQQDAGVGPAFQQITSATTAVPNLVVGRMWVKYVIEFCSPKKSSVSAGGTFAYTQAEVLNLSNGSSGEVAEVETTTTSTFPGADLLTNNELEFFRVSSDDLHYEYMVPIGQPNNGVKFAIEQSVPNYNAFVSANGVATLNIVDEDGNDMSHNFLISPPTLRQGRGSVHFQNTTIVPGLVAWAVTSLANLATTIFVKVVVPALKDAATTYIQNGVLSVTEGEAPKDITITDKNQNSVLVGIGQSIWNSLPASSTPLTSMYGVLSTNNAVTSGHVQYILTLQPGTWRCMNNLFLCVSAWEHNGSTPVDKPVTFITGTSGNALVAGGQYFKRVSDVEPGDSALRFNVDIPATGNTQLIVASLVQVKGV